MLGRVTIFVLWSLHFLALPVLAPIGKVVGMLAYALVSDRRRTARTNLKRCFPALTPRQRERLVRQHFRCFGRAILEAGIGWWGSSQRLQKTVRIEGREHVDALRDAAFICFAPHFVGLELAGARVTMDYRGVAVYVHQKDPYVDAFLKRKRERFEGTRMIARQEGVKAILRALRSGQALQLSPDMDLGARDAVFVPFFGVPTATVTALSRIARLTRAHVVPLVVRQLPGAGGYVARFYPAWEDYPGGSVEQDTRRMNAFIEERVREMPEQYLWTHRRFKTRPPGEAGYY